MRTSHPKSVLYLPSLFLLTFLSISTLFSPAVLAQVEQNYIDDEDGSVHSFDPSDQFQIRIINKSRFRVDVHWDDGVYGSHMGILEATNNPADNALSLNTEVGHAFFVTKHGMKERLFDPSTNTALKFEVLKPHHIFTIEEDAAPSADKCQDRFDVCARHAKAGNCHSSPGWMIVHCCKSCDEVLDASRLIDPKVRCDREALNMTGPAWSPGDLNTLFTSWVTEDKFKKWEPVVLSSPGGSFGGKDGPWVVTFDNFMSDWETKSLIEGGEISGFDRSTDQGATNELGEQEKIVSTTRTSSNAWCNPECEALPGVKSVTNKIEDATNVPRTNYESFQVLEYGHNQFYRSHHDTSHKEDSIAGHRIMTFFLYLSDVEEGGETYFNQLDIAVKPKKGRALIWPSVQDDDPTTWDARMYHQAKDVIKGKKYAANHWIHQYDYMTPNKWGCTGSFS